MFGWAQEEFLIIDTAIWISLSHIYNIVVVVAEQWTQPPNSSFVFCNSWHLDHYW